MRGYAKGLAELGKEVYVILPESSENADTIFNCKTKGRIDGISFEYTCGRTVRPRSFIRRRLLTLRGMAVGAARLLKLMWREGVEAVIVYPDYLAPTLWFWLVTRLRGTPFILEKSEHPFSAAGRKPRGRAYQFIYTRLILRRFDGVMVISDYLDGYLRGILGSKVKIIKIPMFVDFDRFDGLELVTPAARRYITYCGLLNEAKDGVVTLMRAFKDIYDEYPDVVLRLVGDSYKGTSVPEYRGYAEELGIAQRVEYLGMVARDEVPKLF